jgi:translocation and assembly module TamB
MNRPTVTLGSDPELPQDEVLSRLLFGRNLASITPYQAIQLAGAANTLAGGGGFDLLGQTRKMLGVDQLEIKNTEGDQGGTAISAGKYLSENVYMEVEKGLGPKGGKGSVVWELTPNISVETEVGENADIGGGVNWKWDY